MKRLPHPDPNLLFKLIPQYTQISILCQYTSASQFDLSIPLSAFSLQYILVLSEVLSFSLHILKPLLAP
jgi:hypothetical protein